MTLPLKIALFLLISFVYQPVFAAPAQNPVARAVEALGGEAALGQLKTVAIRGSNIVNEIESSLTPGKAAESRQGSESKFFIQRDLTNGTARIDWERKVVRTPKPLIQNYSEIMADGLGYVSGIDSAARTQFSVKSNPPGHPMSGARAAVTLRELTRQSPRLVLDMKMNPNSVKAVAAQTAGGRKFPAVQYDVRDWRFTVLFDPKTGLPDRVRTRDPDPIQGDSNYDLVFADWRSVGGVQVAHSLTYQLNERDLVVTKYEQVTPNPALAAGLFEIPIMARAIAVRAATGNVPYQWIIRRGYWGNLLDSDEVGWDPAVMAEPTLVDIAPGVSVSQGSSANSVVVEMDRYLVVFDAPYHERFSEWMIQASKKRYPGKPIKYLVQSHHHWDHASGARTYVAEGATVVVGKGGKEHFARMFAAPGTALNDRLHRNPRAANIVEVNDKHVIKDGKREVHAYLIESAHAKATLLSYVPDAKLGFIVDIWSTNVPLPPKPTAGHREVVAGVKKWGLTPELFANGHGVASTPYSQLAKLVGN